MDYWGEIWLSPYEFCDCTHVTWPLCLNFSHLQNAITVTTLHIISTQCILITVSLWFLLSYICVRAINHICPKILFFSLIFPSFFIPFLYELLTILISFSGYTLFCKYSSKSTVSRTECSRWNMAMAKCIRLDNFLDFDTTYASIAQGYT